MWLEDCIKKAKSKKTEITGDSQPVRNIHLPFITWSMSPLWTKTRSRMNNAFFSLHVPNLYESSYWGQTEVLTHLGEQKSYHSHEAFMKHNFQFNGSRKKRFIFFFPVISSFCWLSKCQHFRQISTHVKASHFNSDENKKTFCMPVAK